MPFPLAHPAAILPLKRFCPRYLSLGALVIGSIVPDVAYLFGRLRLDEFSHTFVGSFGFSLPVGMLSVWLFYGLRQQMVEWLPDSQRRLLMPLCQQPVPPVIVLVISVLIGAWTHLLWDSFTHSHGWLVLHEPLLQVQLMQFGDHRLLLCHLLWYVSSFVGFVLLCLAYEKWLQRANLMLPQPRPQLRLRNALLAGLLLVPLEAVHHLAGTSIALVLLGVLSIILAVGVMLMIGRRLPNRSQNYDRTGRSG
ncbi:MAG TPA: DUF4184 family protein [Verrucomicrobiae bacterium]|nr:DUF4184 family protein [Verrucomicrobiae bacterium]